MFATFSIALTWLSGSGPSFGKVNSLVITLGIVSDPELEVALGFLINSLFKRKDSFVVENPAVTRVKVPIPGTLSCLTICLTLLGPSAAPAESWINS